MLQDCTWFRILAFAGFLCLFLAILIFNLVAFVLKGAGLWFPPPFSYEYVIIGDLFSKCCGFHNSLHVCRNQAVKRPQSCGQTHPMTVAMKLMETLVKSAWEKCLTC